MWVFTVPILKELISVRLLNASVDFAWQTKNRKLVILLIVRTHTSLFGANRRRNETIVDHEMKSHNGAWFLNNFKYKLKKN